MAWRLSENTGAQFFWNEPVFLDSDGGIPFFYRIHLGHFALFSHESELYTHNPAFSGKAGWKLFLEPPT